MNEFFKFKNLKKIILSNQDISIQGSIAFPHTLNTLVIFLSTVLELDVNYVNPMPTGYTQASTLKSIPNVEKLSYYDYTNNELISFELIKYMVNIKHLIYSNCLNIKNLEEIKNWCTLKNIKLYIKS